MMDEKRTELARSIGSLTAGGEELLAYVFVPQERLAELVAVAQSGHVQTIDFSDTKLRYRSALVRSITIASSMVKRPRKAISFPVPVYKT